MRLSERMQAVGRLAGGGICLADVGCDHAYLAIELTGSGRYQRAIAMDINEGPLMRAKTHIAQSGLEDRISVRLSDGLSALGTEACDTVVIAGMGGALTIRILAEAENQRRQIREWILQPQSELYKVRRYLVTHGYRIEREDMVFEDGKFYPMMQVVNGDDTPYNEIELLYGRHLLRDQHPVLIAALTKEIETKEKIAKQVKAESPDRYREIAGELALARAAYLKCLQV